MVEVGRDLCGSSTPTALSKQGHPEQAAQDLVQVGTTRLRRIVSRRTSEHEQVLVSGSMS